MKIVYIKWLDSVHTSNWINSESLEFNRSDLEHESVGFLLKETDYSYILVQSKGRDVSKQPHVDSVMEIPKAAVEKFKVLKNV